jgi:predicted N-formylglutamate amidohydrolase
MTHALLSPNEPPAFRVERPNGSSSFLFTVDHASHRLPKTLGDLGLSAHELHRHIAWDIGIEGVGRHLSEQLDACMIAQQYSRLVIDCNRPPGSPGSILEVSERTRIPGNERVSDAQRKQREDEVFWPYQNRIQAALDERRARGQTSVVVALHSFTPVYMDEQRSVEIGVLYERDARLAAPLLAVLRAEQGLNVGDNTPYAMSLSTDFTMSTHALDRGLLHVELEIRQDLIGHDAQCAVWAERLARWLPAALAQAQAAA